MSFKEMLARAQKRCKEWNETETKKRDVEDFLLNEIFEQYGGWDLENILLKELAAYVMDTKEGRAAENFIEHLKEYQEGLFEDE